MQPVSLYLRLKGNLVIFLEELIFRKYPHARNKVSAELQNTEIFFITLLKCNSTTDTVSAFFNFFYWYSNVLLLCINLATFWNQKYGCFRTYMSYQKSSHAEISLQSTPLKNLVQFSESFLWDNLQFLFQRSSRLPISWLQLYWKGRVWQKYIEQIPFTSKVRPG